MFYWTRPRATPGHWQMSGHPMVNERRERSGGCGQLALGSRLTRVTCSQYDNHAPRVSSLSEYSQSREEKALSYSEVLNSNSSASESGF